MPTPNDYSDYRFQPNPNASSGEFTQTAGAPPAPEVPSGTYPALDGGYSETNRQFSMRPEFQTGESIPEILQNSTKACIEDHASYNAVYGLHQPEATPGSHSWLRDALATPSEQEPGNAEPTVDKTPFSGS